MSSDFPSLLRRLARAGISVRVLTIDALIAAKEAMNRPRDREAIRQLRAIKELESEGG